MSETILITGASAGIGLEMAKLFAERHCDLVIVSKTASKLEKIKSELEAQYGVRVKAIAKDLSADNAPREIYDALKEDGITVDILVNNAALGDFGRFIDIDYEKEKDIAVLNMLSLMHMTHLFANDMVKRSRGRILNVASIAALLPGPYMSVYYASKGFVLLFSEAISRELTGSGVTVTTLCPGPTYTEFEKNADMKDSLMFRLPLIKPITAREVALEGYDALMKGKRLHFTLYKWDVLKFLAGVAPEKVKLIVAEFINTGKIKASIFK